MIQSNAARAVVVHQEEIEVIRDEEGKATDLSSQERELGDVKSLFPRDQATLFVVVIDLGDNGDAILDHLEHTVGVSADVKTLIKTNHRQY